MEIAISAEYAAVRSCNARAEDLVEDRYVWLTEHVRFQAVTLAMRLFCTRPDSTDDEVLAQLWQRINPIADWNMENE